MSHTCSNCFTEIPDGESTCPVCGYSPDKDSGKYPMALPAGTILNGRYILGRTLGQGGFGITYVAKDHKTGNLVAVKEYFPETLATRTNDKTISAYTDQREENFSYGKECFLKEAETLAQFIGNPNIVRVYSYFEENNTAYFVMDYVDGVSLRDYLKEQGKISWEKAKELLFPIMDALSEVHSRGIIHRDVTPDNIYITKDGVVKLLDFGAARYSLGDRSRSLDVVLKPGFAPREQYSRRSRQGPYTDVYALAATYYFAITGRLPPDSIDRQDHDELILPSSLGVKIPPEEEDALCKALAVSSLERFQSIAEFKQAINITQKQPQAEEKSSVNGFVQEKISAETIQSTEIPKADTAVQFVKQQKIDNKEKLKEAEKIEQEKKTKETPKKKGKRKFIFAGSSATAILIVFLIVLNTVIIPNQKYNNAINLMNSGDYEEAISIFNELGDYSNAEEKIKECNFQNMVEKNITTVSGDYKHTIGLKSNGTVVAVGDNGKGQCNIKYWTNIVSISTNVYHTIGLRSEGTVVAVGDNEEGQCDVKSWKNIVAISTGRYHTVGLKGDGTVVAVGNNEDRQCDVFYWKNNNVSVAAGDFHTVSLKSDGTVSAVGWNAYDQCDVESWRDIVKISAGFKHTVGLKSDGTVVAVGDNEYGQCNVGSWRDIVAISAGESYTVGLKSDGTVVAVGENEYGQCDVEDWKDIVDIFTGPYHTLGLKSDGTVVAVGDNDNGECDVESWTNIKVPED